ncbi:MAG: pyrroline-5-carboxylate reductase [Rhodospirillales bacterium]
MAEALLLAGCGKMGGALLGGWLDKGLPADSITVVEPHEETAKAVHQRHGVRAVNGPGGLDGDFRPATVVLAVKPQSMDEVAPAYAGYAGPGTVFLSIAAGKTLAYFAEKLGPEAAVVRAMPNTPASVGRGITVACANGRVDEVQKGRVGELLEAVGEVAWIDDEGLMDAVTAVSGSGPAYVFLLAECLAQAGEKAGLPADLSRQLAEHTVAGAGELLHQAGEPASELRANVTSPGGTTAAALEVLMADGGWADLMTEAIAAGARRSKELAG